MHPQSGEGVSNRVTSFDIRLSDFVKYFNRQQGILIKNLPNKMLSDKQIQIKDKITFIDNEREKKQLELQS